MSPEGSIVFDAEPLIAYLNDEPGADVVEKYLNALENGDIDGYMSPVTLAEVRYICRRELKTSIVTEFLDYLTQFISIFEARQCWRQAADIKYTEQVPLGDAFALATQMRALNPNLGSSTAPPEAKLLVGADDHFDDFESIIRFRSEPG